MKAAKAANEGQNSLFTRPRRWVFRSLARREERCDLSDHERRATKGSTVLPIRSSPFSGPASDFGCNAARVNNEF